MVIPETNKVALEQKYDRLENIENQGRIGGSKFSNSGGFLKRTRTCVKNDNKQDPLI